MQRQYVIISIRRALLLHMYTRLVEECNVGERNERNSKNKKKRNHTTNYDQKKKNYVKYKTKWQQLRGLNIIYYRFRQNVIVRYWNRSRRPKIINYNNR